MSRMAIDYGPLAARSATATMAVFPISLARPGKRAAIAAIPGRTSRSRLDADDPVSALSLAS